MSQRSNITAATAVLSSATMLSRFAGLARDMIIAALFGAGFGSDAFFLAFTIPNLLRRFFAEGSLTAAFVPTFTRVRASAGESEARRVVNICWTVLLVVMALVSVVGICLAPWLVQAIGAGFADVPGKLALTVHLTRIMFPYIFFVSLLALFTGVLNVYGHYFVPALSPLLLNICMVASAVLLRDYFASGVEALAWGVVAGGIGQLLMTMPVLRRHGFNLRLCWQWGHASVRRIAALMLPGIAGVAIYQINIVVTRLLSSFLPQGSVSYLYYGQRLFEFPQGIFVVSLAQAVLPTMSRQATEDIAALKDSLRHAMNLIMLVTIPAAAGLALCAEPIYTQLFMGGAFSYADVQQTALALMAYAPGLLFVGISRIVVPTFYAMEDTRTPVLVSAGTLAVNVVLALLLMGPYRHVGLAAALTLASVFNAVMLVWLLYRRIGGFDWSTPLITAGKVGVATLLMTVAVHYLLQFGRWSQGVSAANLLVLTAAIAAGMLVYASLCYALRIKEIHELITLVRRRLRR